MWVIMMMYVGDAQGGVAVLAAVCCCHGDGQQQCVVAMEEMPAGSDNTTLWPQECIAQKHTHTAVAYNTTLWPQCIAPKHTQTVAREDFITQRFGHNVLHPNTHTQR
jgi:hypothetical protein